MDRPRTAGLEHVDDLVHVLRPVLRRLGTHAVEDALERGREIRPACRERRQRGVHLVVEDLPQVLAGEGRRADEERPRREAQGVHVRPHVDLLAAALFRAHVGRRPRHDAFLALHDVAGDRFREAEVGDLHAAVRTHEDVRRLHVAVDDPLVVGRGEAGGGLDEDVEAFHQADRAVLVDELIEAVAADVLHREEAVAAVAAHVVDVGEVRVVDSRRRARLLEEAVDAHGDRRLARAQHLHRHRAIQALIVGAVHRAHGALPDLLLDPVVREHGAGG